MRVWLLAGLIFSGDLVLAASLTKETETETECGVKLDFRGDVGTVIGGNKTEKHEYPWMVYVCGEYDYEYEKLVLNTNMNTKRLLIMETMNTHTPKEYVEKRVEELSSPPSTY